MSQVIRQGRVTAELSQGELLAHIDKISDGAATAFLRGSRGILEPIRDSAVPRWPVRTGRSKRGFAYRERILPTEIRAELANQAHQARWGYYAFRIRWSVRTRDSLRREAADAASRGTTPESAAKILTYWQRKLRKRHGEGAPSADLAGKQPWRVLVRTPANKAVKTLAPTIQADLARLADLS